MPELQHDNTTAIPPERLLARTIAEYVATTRGTLANIRALRHGFYPRDPELNLCSYEKTLRAANPTGEDDQSFPCGEPSTVYNFADDAEYCARHHQKAEENR